MFMFLQRRWNWGEGGLEGAEPPQLFGWEARSVFEPPSSRNPNLQILRFGGAVSQNKLGDEIRVAQSAIRLQASKSQEMNISPHILPLAGPSWGTGLQPVLSSE